jgi:hypothetical protein
MQFLHRMPSVPVLDSIPGGEDEVAPARRVADWGENRRAVLAANTGPRMDCCRMWAS